MCPPFWLLARLLRTPGDGPGVEALYPRASDERLKKNVADGFQGKK